METAIDRRAAAMRRFNRFYTRRIGVVREGLLQSPFSLAEVRVLYELAHRDNLTAKVLGTELELDAGYLSRLISDFERRGLITRTASKSDGRQRQLLLTAAGRRAFAPLDRRAHDEIVQMLGKLPSSAQTRLIEAMQAIESLLSPEGIAAKGIVLRPPRPGDMGWVVQRHGELYAEEYGYDATFEALVAEIVADFVRRFDPARDCCWIAERGGEAVGSVFVVRKSRTIAKLRLFIVDPAARGTGIGARLVDECTGFARRARYRTLTLWTQSDLLAARHLYQRAGFRRVASERHQSFGHDLVGETWELQL
jgi:DNA-binding MarR family transcriptional regulator/GNAT superfamily N-acetyltransferase